uniref:Cytochrome c biogenesis protein Ccs1 n=1 Tax=Astrosyne radiata TaxID=1158023 RepID=A0A2U9NTC4_9STRA|nr:c-type cytochrome biogenesis protein [Astrosyne radiata]AWT40381.1 c-type cytochrome biogenesis protein [Astrosyne radiata]
MKKKIFHYLADLRFAIIMLTLISLCSIIGTLIEQEQSIAFYKLNYPFSKIGFQLINWSNILYFNFDHIYTTGWFLSLLVLFGFSLLTCTLIQQFPSLKIVRRCQFFRIIKQFNVLFTSKTLVSSFFPQIITSLKKQNYTLFQQKNTLYFYKGLIGKIAPIFVHFSIILILTSTLISAINGFKAQQILEKLEVNHIQNVLSDGKFTYIPNITYRINDSWINYKNEQLISQFYSNFSILNKFGIEVKNQTNFINFPFIYRKLYYYQTDWNLTKIRLIFESNQLFEFPLLKSGSTDDKIWLTWIVSNLKKKTGILLILDNLLTYLSVYNNQGMFLGNLELNEKFIFQSTVTFLEVLNSIGLQVKNDPGTLLLYDSFLFLLVSIFLSYINYTQIWILYKNSVFLLGTTNNRTVVDLKRSYLVYLSL